MGFYGHIFYVAGDSGSLLAQFRAFPTDTDRVWSLNWDGAVAGDGGVGVTLKDEAPPNLEQGTDDAATA